MLGSQSNSIEYFTSLDIPPCITSGVEINKQLNNKKYNNEINMMNRTGGMWGAGAIGYMTIGYMTIGYMTIGYMIIGYMTIGYMTIGYMTICYMTIGYMTIGYMIIGVGYWLEL